MNCKNHDDRPAEWDSLYGEGKLCFSCALKEVMAPSEAPVLREFPLAQPC
jgi:hypothetical protein